MLKPPTGEPCAGEPHARFGGRGGLQPFPTPIKNQSGRLLLGEEVELFIAAELDLEGEGTETGAFEEEDRGRLTAAAHTFGAEGIGILTG
jgi:hypothetical protein